MMKFSRYLLIPALAALAFAGTASAQDKAQAGSDSAKQLVQSYRQKSKQLHEIQQKAIKNSPELASEMKKFQSEVDASMNDQGYDVQKGREHMKAMATKLQSKKKLSKEDRMATMKSMQVERQKMVEARAAAMKDPAVKKDGKALQQNMIAAMKKQDSQTGQLLKDMQSLRSRIMASSAPHRAKPGKG